MIRYGRRAMAAGLALAIVVMAGGNAAAADAGFACKDQEGQHLDILRDGRLVARYLYAYDKSRLKETSKTFLHVFDEEGKAPITGALAKQYPHHRGIFIGWNRLSAGGKSFDMWHMPNGQQVHQKFLKKEASADGAAFTSLVHWVDGGGQPVIEEERTMAFRPLPAPGLVLIDFETRLKSSQGDARLDGDPEHAGIQYRPAGEVTAAETTYVFPKEGADPHKDRDYPWVGESYTLGGKRYSVVHMNHPDNPKETVYSAYRDYGRFGAFFKKDLKAGETLVLKYRFRVSAGEMPAAAEIQKCWDAFAGAKDPSPVPKTTVTGGAKKK
jgi:hypothetical protein